MRVENDKKIFAVGYPAIVPFLMEEYRGYATVEELLFAAECGEVDAAVVRAEDVEDYWALTESMLPTEGTVVLSSAAEELGGDRARQALVRAFLAAAESDEGIELLKQYGCGGFAAVTEEEIGAMRSLAMWEELKCIFRRFLACFCG